MVSAFLVLLEAQGTELFHDFKISALCQTQAVQLTWCPLRAMRCTGAALRSLSTREHGVDIHLLSSHDHCADEALDHRLTLFERELIPICPQEVPKGLRLVHDLVPRPRRLVRLCERLEFLGDLWPCGRHVPPATLSCVQAAALALRGIESARALPLEPLSPLEQLRLLRGEGGDRLRFDLRPRLVEVGKPRWCPSPLPERVPHTGVEPIGAPAP